VEVTKGGEEENFLLSILCSIKRAKNLSFFERERGGKNSLLNLP